MALFSVGLRMAEENVATISSGSGSVYASLVSVEGGLATYNVSLTLPIGFVEQQVFSTSQAIGYLSGSGTLTAAGQFTRAVPEPSVIALLVLGLSGMIAYAWRKRRCVPS